MPHESVEDETTVNDSYSITVPSSVRTVAGIEASDKLRWRVTNEGDLSVEVVKLSLMESRASSCGSGFVPLRSIFRGNLF